MLDLNAKINKSLSSILVQNISSSESAYLAKLLKIFKKVFLPCFITQYYSQSKSKNFFVFLKNFKYSDVIRIFPANLSQIFLKARENIKIDLQALQGSTIKVLGDLHNAGATKYLIGGQVRHKSRFGNYKFLQILCTEVLPEYQKFFALPNKISKDHYIYRDYITPQLQAQQKQVVAEYYFNLGQLMPLLLFLRTVDIYAANAICRLPYLVVIDYDCMLSPQTKTAYSILRSGMIKADPERDKSLLTGGLAKSNNFLTPTLQGSAAKPKLKWGTITYKKFVNIPELNHVKVNPMTYWSYLEAGYQTASAKLIKKKSQISELLKVVNCGNRINLRLTAIYNMIQQFYCFPENYQKNPNVEEFFYTQLRSKYIEYKVLQAEWLFRYEAKILANGLIPIFYMKAYSDEIYTPEGKVIARLEQSPLETFQKFLPGMEGFLKKQLEIMRKTYF